MRKASKESLSTFQALFHRHMSRPSLLRAVETSHNINILDTLQASPSSNDGESYTKRRLPWMFGIAIVLGVGAVLTLSDSGSQREQARTAVATPAPSASGKGSLNAPRVEMVAAASPLSTSQAPGLDPAVDAGRAPPERTSKASASAAIAALALPAPTGLAPVVVPSPAQAKRAIELVPHKGKSLATAKTAAQAAPAPRPKADKIPRVTAPAKGRSTDGRTSDPDVELLSALMQHMGNGTSSTAASRTLAEQLSDCQRGERGDVVACQRRVCAGMRGQAKTCPPHLAPTQAGPTREPHQPS